MSISSRVSILLAWLPLWLSGKESTCTVRDMGLIPGLERSPGEGKGYPIQYSAWRIPWAYSPRGCIESDTTKWRSLSQLIVENRNFTVHHLKNNDNKLALIIHTRLEQKTYRAKRDIVAIVSCIMNIKLLTTLHCDVNCITH